MLYHDFFERELPVLLDGLTEQTTPLWGKMNAQQMIEHLSSLFLISNGKVHFPNLVQTEAQAASFFDRFFVQKQDFVRNIRTSALPEDPLPPRFKDLAEAKAKFLGEIARFHSYFAQNTTATPLHPMFGQLTYAQWAEFHVRHIGYHFGQFGSMG